MGGCLRGLTEKRGRAGGRFFAKAAANGRPSSTLLEVALMWFFEIFSATILLVQQNKYSQVYTILSYLVWLEENEFFLSLSADYV